MEVEKEEKSQLRKLYLLTRGLKARTLMFGVNKRYMQQPATMDVNALTSFLHRRNVCYRCLFSSDRKQKMAPSCASNKLTG